MQSLSFVVPRPQCPRQPLWLLPVLLAAVSLAALAAAIAWPASRALWYFVPYTFLGNSLAPLPYDGAVIWLAAHVSVPLVVAVGVAATVLIEWWNMELLARLLARDTSRGFRRHPLTRWTLRAYQRAPFWSLVATCVLPIVPHYPMRVLAVLDGMPMWKYQLSVVLGRGTRYAWLALLGWAIRIPVGWIVAASLVVFVLGVRGARRMNRDDVDAREAPAAAEIA